MERRRISSGTEWEARVGYSRAVRVGDCVPSETERDDRAAEPRGRVLVAGTTATDEDGAVVAAGDPYQQTVRALENVERALAEADATVADVVRTRLFVTDIADWEAVGEAHGEFFADVRPASTMVEVSRLIDDDLVVEVEAEAVVGSDSTA